jgi:hypothetical protein
LRENNRGKLGDFKSLARLQQLQVVVFSRLREHLTLQTNAA